MIYFPEAEFGADKQSIRSLIVQILERNIRPSLIEYLFADAYSAFRSAAAGTLVVAMPGSVIYFQSHTMGVFDSGFIDASAPVVDHFSRRITYNNLHVISFPALIT